MADDTGVTRRDAAIRQWIGADSIGINPETLMDAEDFQMAQDYMFSRVMRMFHAMLTAFPTSMTRIQYFLSDWNFGTLRQFSLAFVRHVFEMKQNRVWKLIRSTYGLTHMHSYLIDYINNYISLRLGDAWQ